MWSSSCDIGKLNHAIHLNLQNNVWQLYFNKAKRKKSIKTGDLVGKKRLYETNKRGDNSLPADCYKNVQEVL